ncbi:hypothetical protein P3TCK_11709 [Photobacterium profundum 3TCK]|uniref:Uncharacterized protein n=1 Tax=Photobacterium profundum 3TCK TaxID=314280 RepID=Q1Z396_9GAMM|nr:hypothetical protein P3TCK_11709 [Photobacterium profundum 3TCK]
MKKREIKILAAVASIFLLSLLVGRVA